MKDVFSEAAKSSEMLDAVRKGLHDYALSQLPALPEDSTPSAERSDAVAAYFGYLDSPLGNFLDKAEYSSLRSKAIAISDTLANSYSPRLGQQFTPPCIPNNLSGWKFVPPCSFKSPASGETRTIDKPFWIFGDLIRNEIYYMFTMDQRNFGKEANEPVTNACWNDMLYFCHRLELALKKHGSLPPGYGVRPPTEDEWECVAVGGWSPKDNPFNIEAMGNGFYESVLGSPEHLTPEEQRDFIVMRGASENESNRALTRWEPMYKDSHFVKKLCFRPVIAPIDDDFYEKQWYTAPVWRTITKGDNIYGNIVTCLACFSSESVHKFCELLGCSMFAPSSMKDLEEIYKEFHINTSFPCLVDISYRDGAWKSNSKDENSTLENLPEFTDGKNLLGAKPKALYAFSEKTLLPNVILVWKNREAFDKRLDFWKSPWEHFTKVDVAGKTYALCKLRASSYSAQTIAEILGTRVATIKAPEELDELCSQFAQLKGEIGIGAQRHIDGWRWNDGTLYSGTKPERLKKASPVVTYMQDSLCIYDGKICSSNSFEWILLEVPEMAE